jgi:hypothetical protein
MTLIEATNIVKQLATMVQCDYDARKKIFEAVDLVLSSLPSQPRKATAKTSQLKNS